MTEITGTARATHAELLAAIGSLITNDGLSAPHGIFAGREGEVTFQMQGNHPAWVEAWALAAGLATPMVVGEPYVEPRRVWHSYDAVGVFLGWQMRVWCSVDEPTPDEPEPLPHRVPDFDLGPVDEESTDRPAAPRVAAQGEADDAGTSPAAGVPPCSGGAPAQDPDSPPYASPMAYRAVPVHEVWHGRRWAW